MNALHVAVLHDVEVACSPLLLTTFQVDGLEVLIMGSGACRVDAGFGSFWLFWHHVTRV